MRAHHGRAALAIVPIMALTAAALGGCQRGDVPAENAWGDEPPPEQVDTASPTTGPTGGQADRPPPPEQLYGTWVAENVSAPVGQVRIQRFDAWRRDGTWDRPLAELRARADAAGRVDWGLWCVDGTNVRAVRHAAGARKKRSVAANRQTTGSAAAGAGGARRCTS